MTSIEDPHLAEALARSSFLLADDSPFMLELMTTMLKAFGVTRIERAPNGARALHMIRDRPFNCVIADWHMQPMDGHTFLRELRFKMRGAQQRIPVVMCTAYTDRDRVLMLRDAGATEILTKPVSPAAVYEKIVRAMFMPRPFVVSETFVGPDRRRRDMDIPFPDRRKKNLAQTVGDEVFFI